MIGRRFGKLLVIERVPSPDRYREWRCLCDCGGTTITRGTHLRSGHSRSCGCGRQRCAETGAATAIDMVGRVIGRLTVLERAGSQQLYGDMSAALCLAVAAAVPKLCCRASGCAVVMGRARVVVFGGSLALPSWSA